MPLPKQVIDLSRIPRISPQAVKERLDRGEAILFVDVRRHPDEAHLKGSVRYKPEDLLRADRVTLPFPKDRLIVPYCT